MFPDKLVPSFALSAFHVFPAEKVFETLRNKTCTPDYFSSSLGSGQILCIIRNRNLFLGALVHRGRACMTCQGTTRSEGQAANGCASLPCDAENLKFCSSWSTHLRFAHSFPFLNGLTCHTNPSVRFCCGSEREIAWSTRRAFSWTSPTLAEKPSERWSTSPTPTRGCCGAARWRRGMRTVAVRWRAEKS